MKIFSLILLILIAYGAFQYFIPPFDDSREVFLQGRPISASVEISGAAYPISSEDGLTVGDALQRAGFTVGEADSLYPTVDSRIFSGARILWRPARTVRIVSDGTERAIVTTSPSAAEIVDSADIALDDDDIVVPSRESAVPDNAKITITRVEIREEVKETKIPFVTKTEEDSELSWRKKIVKQKGENGVKTTMYRVSYHNGKEVNRKTLSTEVTKEPVTEVVTQGTYVKTGKSHRGAASWYAWTGTMAAANPWLPKGSYVRVTNIDNGKSVIVVINDRGPFVPGRIIDLDKVAFEKIASIGAGVINVKMEEIVN